MSLALTIPRCQLSVVGAEFAADLNVTEWREIGRQLDRVGGSLQWLLGDWWNAGGKFVEHEPGQSREDVAVLVDRLVSNLPEDRRKSLRMFAWVARQVPVSRRVPALSWSHHQEVAALTPSEQRQWLARAERNGWTVADLRAHLAGSAERPGRAVGDGFNWLRWISEGLRAVRNIPIENMPQPQRAALARELRELLEALNQIADA